MGKARRVLRFISINETQIFFPFFSPGKSDPGITHSTQHVTAGLFVISFCSVKLGWSQVRSQMNMPERAQ